MGMAEFNRWVEFDSISPIGDERHDYNAANAVHWLSNALGKSRVPLSECVIKFDRRSKKDKKVLAAKVHHHFLELTKKMGGTVNGKDYSKSKR